MKTAYLVPENILLLPLLICQVQHTFISILLSTVKYGVQSLLLQP